MPEISVIMSVYNGEAYLEEAIESIRNQTFPNWELVVINDCSTDATGEMLAAFAAKDERIRVHTNAVNLKLPASLNKAISLCRGKYIARMDADDISLPDRLEKQYRFMEANKDVMLSSCRFLTVKNGVYASGGAGGRCDPEAIRAMLLVSNPILHPGVIARAQVMQQFGYDTTLTCTEDLDLWTRLAVANQKMQILPECLLIYRLHDKQITKTTLAKQHVEVLNIQQKHYASLLQEMDAETQAFYISGIYFREQPDIQKFLAYAKWLRTVSAGNYHKDTIRYVLFEILAEYKRHGVSKTAVVKAMLALGPVFAARELVRRKKAAREDIRKCTLAAKAAGLKQTGGTQQFPIFGE